MTSTYPWYWAWRGWRATTAGGSDIAVATGFALPCAASFLVVAVRMAGGSLSTTLAADAIPLVALLVVVLAAVEP